MRGTWGSCPACPCISRALHSDHLFSFRRHRTVSAETCRVDYKPISRLNVHDMAKRSCKDHLTTCLSSRVLVAGDHWSPLRSSVWPSSAYQFHIRVTVVEFRRREVPRVNGAYGKHQSCAPLRPSDNRFVSCKTFFRARGTCQPYLSYASVPTNASRNIIAISKIYF
jgi:hypothetical protein